MTLIQDARDTLTQLAGHGWQPLFDLMGIDPVSPELSTQLSAPVAEQATIQSLPGFEEMAREAIRPIEPGNPARSILFHALSSPAVTKAPDGAEFTAFPTPLDLDRIENLVFGIDPPSIEDLLARFPGQHLCVGVFASEYRQKAWTSHALHADMVFSRCGITRVGTLPAAWNGALRSFSPLESGDDVFAFRTLPCRYAAYIAVQVPGNREASVPFKFDRRFEAAEKFNFSPPSTSDSDSLFWVPVHKIFHGEECIRGHDLLVDMNSQHYNEKLRRIHAANMGRNELFDSGFSEPAISESPFVLSEELAEFLTEPEMGPGVLNAIPKSRLVEPVALHGTLIGAVMPAENEPLQSSFNIRAKRHGPPHVGKRGQHAPEYMHVRQRLLTNGQTRDLNKSSDVVQIVKDGRVGNSESYTALHHADFTGDGWVSVTVTGAPSVLDRQVPAYSLVAAPDFYPNVSQSDVLDWSLNVPSAIRADLWRTIPLALCDERSPPNLAHLERGAPFVAEDVTVSSIVGLFSSGIGSQNTSSSITIDRPTYLSDGAAGVFAPGWDASLDFDPKSGVHHLAAHGLGSPFPEDAKLCAALSAFWPAVAPDISRSANRDIIAPMTDEESGLGNSPAWDGYPATRIVIDNGNEFLEEHDIDHMDYVTSALEGLFTLSRTMLVDRETYQMRILATHRLLLAIDSELGEGRPRMASFEEARDDDNDLHFIQQNVIPLAGRIYRYVMVEPGGRRPIFRDPNDDRRWLARSSILAKLTAYVDERGRIAYNVDSGNWKVPVMS